MKTNEKCPVLWMGSNVQADSPVNSPFMGKSFNLYIIHEDICRQEPWGQIMVCGRVLKPSKVLKHPSSPGGLKKKEGKLKLSI